MSLLYPVLLLSAEVDVVTGLCGDVIAFLGEGFHFWLEVPRVILCVVIT